jgi:hypothetical protein
MKSTSYKKIIIAVIIQLLAASVFGQKYENGTKLLKGAEVLSATPLQLDYVLEKLADTAKITVNLHEGKTHLVLDDGSGKWREWWYHEGHWKPKIQGSDPVPQVNADWNATGGAAQILNKPNIPDVKPDGLEGSIQTKQGNTFAGSTLGVSNGFIKSLSASDVGFSGGNTFLRYNPDGLFEHYLSGKQWNFRSSLPDTTFYVRNRITLEPENLNNFKTSIMAKNGKMKLESKFNNNYSHISIKGDAYNERGVELVGYSDDFFSKISVADSKGINLNLFNTSKTISNEINIGLAQTNMSLIRGDKSRVFSLDENRLQFITRQGSDIITNFNLDDKFFEYRNAENTQLKINYTSLYFKPGGDLGSLYFQGKGLQIDNTISFVPNDRNKSKPYITMTDDDELLFRRDPYRAITLKEIIERGQIYKQSTEPTIPNESFAFWVDGSTFYLILRSGNVQKKMQFN